MLLNLFKKKKFTKEQVFCKKVNWVYDKYWVKIENIWTDKNLILKKIWIVCMQLNEKYKNEKIRFFIDPSYEQWFAVSIPWLFNEQGASFRIIGDNNLLSKKRGFFNWPNYYFSFLGYDIKHAREKDLLIEAGVKFMNLN